MASTQYRKLRAPLTGQNSIEAAASQSVQQLPKSTACFV